MFKESEGLPLVFESSHVYSRPDEVLNQTVKVSATPALATPCQQELSLEGDVIMYKLKLRWFRANGRAVASASQSELERLASIAFTRI